MKAGDKVIVSIGKSRGYMYKSGFLPDSMLPDGTITTIRSVPKDPKYWIILEEDTLVYPRELLKPHIKLKLLKAIKDFK